MNIEPISAVPPHCVLRPVMRQSWVDLTFLHWRYPATLIRPLVPRDLQLDLSDCAAWVGLVPFRVIDLTLPRAPALPWLSNFHETNLRTYVVDRHGARGVWFFSLDAARLLAVIGARVGFALPYFWARMTVEPRAGSIHYRSARRYGGEAVSDIEVQIGEPVATPSELEVFLTARWRLFAKRSGRLTSADVEHQPWPLQRATVTRLDQTLLQAAGIPPPENAPLAHFAHRVDVLVAGPGAVLDEPRIAVE